MANEEREALILGIVATEVTRDLPIFGASNRGFSLESGACARYSYPRQSGGTPATWRLLQRDESDGAQMPNGYKVEPQIGEFTSSLVDALRAFALEFPEDFYELEATASEVSAFWEPHGGTKRVRKLHVHLERLSAL